MPGKALGVVQRWRCVNEPTEPGHESAADRCQTVLAQLAVVAAVTHGKARLQDRLHLPGPETVGMIFLQFLASSEQVIQAGLVQRGSVGGSDTTPHPVAHEHPVEVGPQNRDGIVEPAAGANGVDRRLRGNERPQPVADGTHPPPGFIRRDYRRVADLLAQRRVGRRGVTGRAVQQVREAARRHLQAERGPQHVGDLCQRYAHLGVQLDDQRHDAGAQLRTGRAQRIRGLQRVAALHAPLTLRAVTHLDVEAAHDRAHRGDFFLILRCHAGHFDRAATVRTRRRDRRRMRLVLLGRTPAARLPAIACTGPPSGTPAAPLRSVLGKGSRLPEARMRGLPGRTSEREVAKSAANSTLGVPPSHLPGGSLPAHFPSGKGCAQRRSAHRHREREAAAHRLGPASRCDATARAWASSPRSPWLPTRTGTASRSGAGAIPSSRFAGSDAACSSVRAAPARGPSASPRSSAHRRRPPGSPAGRSQAP